MPWTRPLLTVHLTATAAMLGVIWVVQLIVYPQFLDIRAEEFVGFHARYTDQILWIVGPLMLAELISGGGVLFMPFCAAKTTAIRS